MERAQYQMTILLLSLLFVSRDIYVVFDGDIIKDPCNIPEKKASFSSMILNVLND